MIREDLHYHIVEMKKNKRAKLRAMYTILDGVEESITFNNKSLSLLFV